MQNINFPILTTDRYLSAVNNAGNLVRERLQAPDWTAYERAKSNVYPKWFSRAILGGLVLVLVSSFIISAGKQAAAAGLVLDELPSKFSHLSALWANVSIAALLLLGEVGSILFLMCAGVIAANAPMTTIWRYQVNLYAWVFRFVAVLCASFSIIGNATISLLDPTPQAAVLQWAVGIGVPLLVLALGLVVERLTLDNLKTTGEQRVLFEAAQRDYQAVITNPALHEAYKSILADCLWTELNRFKAQRDFIEPMVNADNRYKRWILSSEYNAHQTTSDVFVVEASNPFLALPDTTASQS